LGAVPAPRQSEMGEAVITVTLDLEALAPVRRELLTMGWGWLDPLEGIRPAVWRKLISSPKPVRMTGREWAILICCLDSCAKLVGLEGILPPPISGNQLRHLLGSVRPHRLRG